MGNPFLSRIRRFPSLGREDLLALDELLSGRARSYAARSEIASEGRDSDLVRVVMQGWACRHRSLSDGRRQILGLLIPGDACSLATHLPPRMDHTLSSLSPVVAAEVPRPALRALVAGRPALAGALGWMEAATLSMQREWTVNLGRRTAVEHLAHLLCEIYRRLEAVGMTAGTGFLAPLTQIDVADAIGLSSVHVSRTLKDMRRAGLVRAQGKMVSILDVPAMERLASFEPGYLMLEPVRREDPDPGAPGYR